MIKIDIVSDAVCPLCYIGKKRLDKAYGISLKLKLPKLLNKKYFPEISYFKVNSNIGIFDTRRLEFKLNF